MFEQLDKFDKFFPKCIKVLAIAGNHDDVMIDCLNNKNWYFYNSVILLFWGAFYGYI